MIVSPEAEAPLSIPSFRDPAGFVFRHEDRILRVVNPAGVPGLEAFLQTRTAREGTRSGRLVRSVRALRSDAGDLGAHADYVIEHERIPFPSYPYEWPPEMLHAAAALTLDFARQALEEGFGLKDATPDNVLFRGSQPVFVDVLSFERRDPSDNVWMAYGQFVRTFLLPLMASRYFGFPLSGVLGGPRDGLEPEALYRWAGWRRRLTPRFLSLVSLPKWMALCDRGGVSCYRRKPAAASPDQARFVVDGILKSCQRHLAALEPKEIKTRAGKNNASTWSGYLDGKSIYTPAQLVQKEVFVAEALALVKSRTVLDVGANEGHFSFLAAREGCSVVAIDSDPVVAGSIWRRAARERYDVLPMVVDLTRPTPAIGWRNLECASFLDRARGKFDLVMMLAVVHHMLVTERVPLEDLLALAGELTREYLLIEFVAPEDPMFQQIMRGREELYSHLTHARFEAAAAQRFELIRSMQLDGLHRWLYLFRRRHAAS
jgi:SAM-dependent methyltransferase